MTKLVQDDIASLTNEQSALAALNSNYALLETFSDSVLSRDGTTPNQMTADLDMNSNQILNLPEPISATEPLRLQDLASFLGGAGSIGTVQAQYVTMATDGNLTSERVLTAGTGITKTDGGAGSTVTIALDTANTRNTDHAGVTLTAGSGLTGGGDITTNRTFTVGAGTGITINADDVALDTTHVRNKLHPASTTDNTVARYDGTGGDIQTSGVTINDSNDVSGLNSLSTSATTLVSNGNISSSSASSFTPQCILLNTTNDDHAAYLILQKSRAGGNTSSSDTLGTVIFQGFANSALQNSAGIFGYQIGSSSGSNIPSGVQVSASNSSGQLNTAWQFDGVAKNLNLPTGGAVFLPGSTSGGATLKTAAVAGTTTFQLPVGNGTSGFVLSTDGSGGTSWISTAAAANTPTRQYLTSGSGATYTTPANCRAIHVKMVGAGGGGGAIATNAGSTGGTSTFNSINAVGGSGGAQGVAGVSVGGAGGTGGSGSASQRLPGSTGASGGGNMSGFPAGAVGAPGIFGTGAGKGGGASGGSGAGGAGGTNTGAGGGGGGGAQNTSVGAGGGGGEYVEINITTPSATYTYTIGTGGAGGTAGTQAGGAGGSGIIIVEEFY